MAFDNSWQMTDWENGLGTDGLNDDYKGTNELKLTSRLIKTAEEIEKCSLDESMTDMDRALHIIREGVEVQKHSVLSALADRFTTDQRFRIVLFLMDSLPKERPDFQVKCGEALTDCFERGLFDTRTANSLLPHLRKMLESREQAVLDCWADTMIAAVQFMSLDVLESEILPEAILNGGLAQPVPFRIWSCRVLGALAKRMDGKRIEATFFKKAMSLCQDTDYEVRSCMCYQLNAIARSIGPELTKSVLLDEYIELLNDEEDVVQQAALNNFVHLFDDSGDDKTSMGPAFTTPVPLISINSTKTLTGMRQQQQAAAAGKGALIDNETKANIVIPIWRKLCADKPLALLPIICKELGLFLFSMRDIIKEDDVEWFVNWYLKMALGKDAGLKEMLAYNFPAIAQYLHNTALEAQVKKSPQQPSSNSGTGSSPLAQHKFFPLLQSALDALSKDESAEVRKRIALGIHEICLLLQGDAHRHMRDIWVRLLMDESGEVYQSIFKTMDQVLSVFSKEPMWTRYDVEFNELLFVILKKDRACMLDARYHWRLHSDLLAQFANFPEYFDPEQIHNNVVPLLFSILLDTNSSTSTSSVRQVATRTLCLYSRRLPKFEYRERIWRVFKERLTDPDTTSYKVRMIFLDACQIILDLFSSKFFKEYFMAELLAMYKDPVPNVRLKWAALLPTVKRTLKIPNDNVLLQRFIDAVTTMMKHEKDKGVLRVLNEVWEKISPSLPKEAHPRNGLKSAGPVVPSAVIPTKSVFELQDKEKEDEETRLLMEEHELDEVRRKRDMEEARQDFSKRLAERTGGNASQNSLAEKKPVRKEDKNATGPQALRRSSVSRRGVPGGSSTASSAASSASATPAGSVANITSAMGKAGLNSASTAAPKTSTMLPSSAATVKPSASINAKSGISGRTTGTLKSMSPSPPASTSVLSTKSVGPKGPDQSSAPGIASNRPLKNPSDAFSNPFPGKTLPPLSSGTISIGGTAGYSGLGTLPKPGAGRSASEKYSSNKK